jgi:hypothetical protein
MEKNLERIGLNNIRQMSVQECEETLLYLRYYLNRLSPGGPRETYQGLIAQLEGRLQPPAVRDDVRAGAESGALL